MDTDGSISYAGPVLRTRGLAMEYGTGAGAVRVLDAVSFDVASGETLAVTGPSGCGKSALLHLLGGLQRPSAGEVWLAGRRMGLSAAQVLPALAGAILGIPGGIALFAAVTPDASPAPRSAGCSRSCWGPCSRWWR